MNKHMNNEPLKVGVIVPPDGFYKPVLYSDRIASYEFNRLNNDVYSSMDKQEKLNAKKTPVSVFVTLSIAALAIAFPHLKKYIK